MNEFHPHTVLLISRKIFATSQNGNATNGLDFLSFERKREKEKERRERFFLRKKFKVLIQTNKNNSQEYYLLLIKSRLYILVRRERERDRSVKRKKKDDLLENFAHLSHPLSEIVGFFSLKIQKNLSFIYKLF